MHQLRLRDSVRAFYDFADKDKSGSLSVAELQIAASLAFPSDDALVQSLVQTIVGQVDVDGDGDTRVGRDDPPREDHRTYTRPSPRE